MLPSMKINLLRLAKCHAHDTALTKTTRCQPPRLSCSPLCVSLPHCCDHWMVQSTSPRPAVDNRARLGHYPAFSFVQQIEGSTGAAGRNSGVFRSSAFLSFAFMSGGSAAGNISSSTLRAAFSYCVQQVRNYDYEHYLCLLHLPPALRRAAFAIRAFNVETARAADNAREANLAIMRLVWWRDALEGMYKKRPVEHPTAKVLSAVIADHRLSRHWFSRLLEARVSDLEATTAPVSMMEVERYAEATASVLLYLTLEAAGVRSTAADHAASHIGKGEGLALLLRATSVHGTRRRTYIPVDIAAKYGLSQEDIYRGKNTEALADAVHEAASVANAHLEKARDLSSSVPKEASAVLLPAVSTGVLLQTLQRSNFNVFDSKITRGVCGVSPLWMQLQLKWHAFRGSY